MNFSECSNVGFRFTDEETETGRLWKASGRAKAGASPQAQLLHQPCPVPPWTPAPWRGSWPVVGVGEVPLEGVQRTRGLTDPGRFPSRWQRQNQSPAHRVELVSSQTVCVVLAGRGPSPVGAVPGASLTGKSSPLAFLAQWVFRSEAKDTGASTLLREAAGAIWIISQPAFPASPQHAS